MKKMLTQAKRRQGTAYYVAGNLHGRLTEDGDGGGRFLSTSRESGLIADTRVPMDQDTGRYMNDNLPDIDGIGRIATTLVFHAF